jgi:hypothetical protein
VWQIELSRDAAKALLCMPRRDALRIRRKIDELARDPMQTPGVKKVDRASGVPAAYRRLACRLPSRQGQAGHTGHS